MGCHNVRLGLWELSTKQSTYLLYLPLLSSVQFLQLVCIFTELVPKVLLDVLTHHIMLSKAFQKKFGKKLWDGECSKHREWLATMMEKNPRVQNFSCAAVRKKPAIEWDVTNLSAALSAVMEPSDVPCNGVDVNQAYNNENGDPIEYFKVDVSASERSDYKAWEGFSINVTGVSPPEVVECVVTEAPSDTQIVAVCREKAIEHVLPNEIKYMPTEVQPVHLPLPEVQDIVKVRQSRNSLYHRSKTEVSGVEFTQCVMSVERLIEEALSPYIPKEDSDSYLTELDRDACSEFSSSV